MTFGVLMHLRCKPLLQTSWTQIRLLQGPNFPEGGGGEVQYIPGDKGSKSWADPGGGGHGDPDPP